MSSNSEFTPVPDPIVTDIDREAGLVFGAVWRFCQGDFGECFATVDTIAARVGMGTTAARKRLRLLAVAGWITEVRRKGETTIYRDSGRWRMRVVGVSEPQRQTLPPPTPDVAPPQRQTLPKKDFKIQTKSIPVATDATGERTEPTAAPSDAWLPLKLAIATTTTGKPKVTGAKGAPAKWIGEIVGDVGKLSGGDPETALAIWSAFEGGLTDDDREKYINPGNVGQRFVKWSLNGGAPAIRGVLTRRERETSGEPRALPDWMAA